MGRTSTYALTNVTLPYALQLANKGLDRACRENPSLALGVNIKQGRVMNKAVAETVGGHAHLIAPEDTEGWRDGMARVLTDDDWWRQLRTGSTEAARPFTWDRSAAQTLQLYRSLTGAARRDVRHPAAAA